MRPVPELHDLGICHRLCGGPLDLAAKWLILATWYLDQKCFEIEEFA